MKNSKKERRKMRLSKFGTVLKIMISTAFTMMFLLFAALGLVVAFIDRDFTIVIASVFYVILALPFVAILSDYRVGRKRT